MYMKILTYDYVNTCLVEPQKLQENFKRLVPAIKTMQAEIQGTHGFAALPNAPTLLRDVQQIIEHKRALKPTALVVIGIGGSNLGTVAVHELLHGKFYNEELPDIKIYFADTVDSDHIWDIVLLVEQELEKGNDILLNVVSKSGTTVEAIANFDIFLQLLKSYRSVYAPYIVVTTDKDSKLWQFAQEEKISCLEIPANVGGRVSVLSAVGLFPLGFIGIDIKQLLDGALTMTSASVSEKLEENGAAIGAVIMAAQYAAGIKIHDTFIFSVDGQSLGAWYRQLVGESLGKLNAAGVPVGITPTVSVGTTDLHSVGQLYLGGPADKFTTFISFQKLISELEVVSVSAHTHSLVAGLEGKTLPTIMAATLAGVKKAYEQAERPFIALPFPEKSAWYVGQFLQLKMFEVVYLAHLLEVNPFDQPHVELYKTETRKILTNE
jgi:glucose-6-phosphate isomerase